jgi:lysozyme family protein
VSHFDAAFEIVVGIEIGSHADGGYTNDPFDPGGETKWGCSKRAYPSEDIKNLTRERAKELFRRDYWDKASCDGYSWELALITFDCAVNQGVSVAASLTGDAARRLAQRAVRYTKSVNFPRFGAGWMARLFTICIQSQKDPR